VAVAISSRTDSTASKVKDKGMMRVALVMAKDKDRRGPASRQGITKAKEGIRTRETVLTTEDSEVDRMDKINTRTRTRIKVAQIDNNLNNNSSTTNNNSITSNSHSRDNKEATTSTSSSSSHRLPHTHLRLPLYQRMKYLRERP
jgi:hypothetical protein